MSYRVDTLRIPLGWIGERMIRGGETSKYTRPHTHIIYGRLSTHKENIQKRGCRLDKVIRQPLFISFLRVAEDGIEPPTFRL